jgi:hypothetical protein
MAVNRSKRRGLGLAGALLGLMTLVQAARAAEPVVVLRPTHRDGQVVPRRCGWAHTGGGDIVVTQPSPDTLVFTLTGAAAAKGMPVKASHAELTATLCQEFEVLFPGGYKPARLTLEARANGLLRSKGKCGHAELTGATASVHNGEQELMQVSLPPRSVGGHEALAVHLAEGPANVFIGPGCLRLTANFRIAASRAPDLCPHLSSAEFAPPPALPAPWITEPDPFTGTDRSRLGFQVIVHAEPLPISAPR